MSIEMIMWVFFNILSIDMVHYMVDYYILKQAYIPRLNLPWLWCTFYMLLDSLCLCSIEDFCTYILKKCWSVVSFLVMSLCSFVSVMLAS